MNKNMAYYWMKKLLGMDKKKHDAIQSDNEISLKASLNPQAKKEQDYIKLVDDTVKEIINSVNGLMETVRLKPQEHELHIYICDNLLYHACKNQFFEEQLEERMYMDKHYVFNRYILHEKNSDEDGTITQVNQFVYIRIQPNQATMPTSHATIQVLEGNGSIIGGVVELDAIYGQNTPYYIGVSQKPKLDNGSIRFNQIAIDDDVNSPFYNQNKYVSRAHAHIKYDSDEFVLYVETGGTPLRGKRTAVFRDSKEIRLDQPGMCVALKDGDQIILSRNVILIFNQQFTNF